MRREPSIRLSQVQDVAGCRIVVPNLEHQIVALTVVELRFDDSTVVDRREHPSHGYRAIHVIVSVRERLVEIQIRTYLQDLWAALCEELADTFGAEIKYGGGPNEMRNLLTGFSNRIAKCCVLKLPASNVLS